ncbi:MAG TPA: cobyrinate a,c-diamide synthase [Dehalococcoidia bacterium]|nr:cobyrinate a,c-diamide synthase [Dehalococcoidia bacterium]
MKLIVIAGTHSGVGKTTVTAGVAAALRRRGLRVQTFKAGPDYIDPSYLAAASDTPCRNLDTWLLTADVIRELVARRSSACDIGIVEGVMGLFDGRGVDDDGSTAQLAKMLGAPVLLVIDGSAMARSAAAVALGYQRLDPDLRIAAVVLNRIAGGAHYEMAAPPVRQATGLPVLGYLRDDPEIRLPERHLGLVPFTEGTVPGDHFARLAAVVEHSLDLDVLLRLAAPVRFDAPPVLFPPVPEPASARIAVALDRAFSFYYQDALDLLSAWGAEVVPFSPLADPVLPAGAGAVWIGGGFPELFADELSANEAMRASLLAAAGAGVPIYGECGGLMYLGRSLLDFEGRVHAMAGVVPLDSRMDGGLTLGYREASLLRASPFLPPGQAVRGHEFHWSTLDEPPPEASAAYRLAAPDRYEGYAAGAIFASYVHIHLCSDARLAPRFVRTAADSDARAPVARRSR